MKSSMKKSATTELKQHRFYKGLVVRRGILAFTSLFKRMSTTKRINSGITVTTLLACLLVFSFPQSITQVAGLVALFIALALYLHVQISRPVKTIVHQMQRVVSGRKTDYYHFDRVDEIGLMMRLVNQSGLNLNSLVDDVGAQISGIGTISQQVAKEGVALQARSEETADDPANGRSSRRNCQRRSTDGRNGKRSDPDGGSHQRQRQQR